LQGRLRIALGITPVQLAEQVREAYRRFPESVPQATREAAPRPPRQGLVRQLRMMPMTAAVLLRTLVVTPSDYLGAHLAVR
ncbi:hypothetical protein ACV35W_35190, partial [Pseudomonas aeruginosa]